MPMGTHLFLFMILGLGLYFISALAAKLTPAIDFWIDIVLWVGTAFYIFSHLSFMDGIVSIATMFYCYCTAMDLTVSERAEKPSGDWQEIELARNKTRLLSDIILTAIVFAGAIIFFIYGPDPSALKYVILFGIISGGGALVKRILNVFSVNVLYSASLEKLHISSRYATRTYPLSDLKDVQLESTADLLRLHPLLTMYSSRLDLTTSFQQVIKLSLPSETLFLTVKEPQRWKAILREYTDSENNEDTVISVLPFYHRKNVKRLLGKLYFAASIKGISAYALLALALYGLHASPWIMAIAVMLYWILNMYLSDRVLRAAMDAKPCHHPHVQAAADKIFRKAGISHVRIYETDSDEYNGMAVGMNVGRSMVILTSATLTLPRHVIEGILAHEAIHIKKRDVLSSQFLRFLYLGAVVGIILLFEQHIAHPAAHKIALWTFIMAIILLFQLYQSFCSQWMEVRADNLGASLLEGGYKQMAEALRILAVRQDEDIKKQSAYSSETDEDELKIDSLTRDKSWLFRLIDFQFALHPPMYWRVSTLLSNKGHGVLKRWLRDRLKESISLK
ncbi:M56 family metallopeptidase [Bacillus inaquosorum]|uniref:M56 family metallopeptidase n=1 Tax=Bacillus inaquosorum TaxID=483913 RepID=UPI00228108FD|nr:M56 family metallopeptidase [Bacillus inaquosorum]MCY8169875.1 M56 family metallopeptidase [Bacillus inaquosorum]MCY8358218.1 M56 family metallopeptidase [Bacillus inaquosorum]MCY9383899.1 M56 family metallopeptidase [Bacillus inaquosorum]MEC0535970.1 M56 family metallopeptidase [Bacillus inaquosorum]